VTTEQALLAQARVQDRDAQRQIYERYFPPLYQFIRLRVNDREQARDIASEVFLDFFIALRSPRAPHTSLRAWLFRVARNKIVDYYGARKQFPLETLEEWLPSSPEESPEAELLQTLNVEKARRALQSLSAEQQEVLVLRFGQALNLQETADLMATTVSAIKSLQFRAMSKLRHALQGMEKYDG
jgi:RNA polymerase sigma-70 factor (ECF subfamily)